MESGASDHAGWNRKRIKECVSKYFDIWCRINISVKNPTPPYKMPMDFLCEECNKKALLVLNSSAKNETLQNWPLLLPYHMWFTSVRVLSATGPTDSLALKAQEVTSF